MASAALVVVVLAPRTLTLGQSVGPIATALPSCHPARLHAALVEEVGAAVLHGRPVLGLATAPFVWPAEIDAPLAQLRGILDPPPAASPGKEGGEGEGGAAAGAASAAAPAKAAAAPPPATNAAAAALDASSHTPTLPRPTPSGGMLVRLATNETWIASGKLATAIAAHVSGGGGGGGEAKE